MTEEIQYKSKTSVYLVVLLVIAAATAAAFASLELMSRVPSQTAAARESVNYFANVRIEGKAAIVIDATNGGILYQKNADAQLPLASLTKVALVLSVAEVLPQDSVLTIPYYAGGTGESGHLSKGEEWRVGDIIDFTLVASSNEGANILADAANTALHERYPDSPADSAALWRMNDIARELNLHSMYFLNVSGLDLSTTQAGAYGSASDVAHLYAYAASAEPSLFAATARNGVLITSTNGQTQNAVNTNDAQGAIPGLVMGKTGTTDLAGGNLAIVFDVGLAHPVVAVVLDSSEKGRFTDMRTLVDAARKTIGGE